MKTPKIAIAGKQGAGKDTLIDFLIRYSCGQWGVVDTSDALVNLYASKLGVPKTEVLKNKQAHRQGLQALGDEIERDRVAGVLKYAFTRYSLTGIDFEGTIFCSIRRPCELYYLQKNGYKIVLVEADRDVREQRRGQLAGESHSTELTDWLRNQADYILKNNGTIEQMEEEALRMLQAFGL